MATTKITVNNNGSLSVEGDFEIVDKNGNIYDLEEEKRFLYAGAVSLKINPSATPLIKDTSNMKP